MRNTVVKDIKSLARWMAYKHYQTLVDEPQKLTVRSAWEYTPDHQYVSVNAPSYSEIEEKSNPFYVVPKMLVISQYTKRWFIKQAKKAYKNV